MNFLYVLHNNIYHLYLAFLPLIILAPFFQIVIFHLLWGREDVVWLAHGIPKLGLWTNQGPHGPVYTGQHHRDWLQKQWTNKVTMEP